MDEPRVVETPPADIVVEGHPHKLVCPKCGLTRHLPDGWQEMVGADSLTCAVDRTVMVERSV